MGLLLQEGFEFTRTATDILRRFPEANSGVPSTLPTQEGMLPSSRCLRIENATCAFRTAALSPASNKICMGVGIRANGCTDSWKQIVILDSSNAEQLSIETIAPGSFLKIRLMRGSTELFLSSQLPLDEYQFLEIESVIHPTAGTWKVRLNELIVGQSTGSVNTANTGSAGYSKILFNPSTQVGAGNYIELDNCYVDDTELYGVIAIEGLVAVADGTLNSMSVLPLSSAHFEAVDDGNTGGADDDTSFVGCNLTVGTPDLGSKLELYRMSAPMNSSFAPKNVRISLDASNNIGDVRSLFIRSIVSGTLALDNLATIVLSASAGYFRYKVDLGPLPNEDLSKEFGFGDTNGSYDSSIGRLVP